MSTTQPATKSKGRPAKASHLLRVHKVTIGFTDVEYAQLKTLAGHEPVSLAATAPGGRITARPRRRYGSIAGHIRAILQNARPPLTPEQLSSISQLVEACNTLNELAQRAEASGMLTVSISLTALQQRISRMLDRLDRGLSTTKTLNRS